MITHKAMLSSIVNVEERIKITNDDVYYSVLPLAHVMERVILLSVILQQGKVGFFHGNVANMKEDLQLLRPTVLLSVPRILNRMAEQIKNKIQELSCIKRVIVQHAINNKLEVLRQTGQYSQWFYDCMYFGPMRESLGGRVRLIASGSAPISQETIDFLKVCLSCPIVQGYGQTEGLGMQFATWMDDISQDCIGGPFS